ncbi:putative enoyl-CoA hydratase echA8 [compost metagenome]
MKWGLVNKVVPSEFLLEEAKAMAKKIASKAPVAVQAAKEMINKASNMQLDESLDAERHKFNSLFATEDQKEGMKAFIEKRKPTWKGK